MTGEKPRLSVSTVPKETEVGAHPIAALVRRYVPGRTRVLLLALVSTIVYQVAKLIPPYLLGVTVDTFFATERSALAVVLVPHAWIPATPKGQFVFLIALFVTAALSTRVAQGIRIVTWRAFQQSVLYDLRTDAYDATQRLDMEFFETEQTGDVMSILTNDINQLEVLLHDGVQTTVQTVTFVIGLFVLMWWLHWQLTLVTLAFVPPILGLVHVYQRMIEPVYDERRSAVGRLNTRVHNSVAGIETIKAFTNEPVERARLAEKARAYWRADWNAAKRTGVFDSLQGVLTSATYITILLVGGWWALFEPPFGIGMPLSAGTFVTFYFYGIMFVSQSTQIGTIIDTYVDGKASAKRVFGLIHNPAGGGLIDAGNATPLESIDGRIAYDDVTFTYPDAESPALRSVNFEIPPTDTVGVVGPTGAGKSTAMKLLLRFHDPESGSITIDGTDIADVTVESLRDAIGYVRQEPYLFDGTIRENIAYGDSDADEEAIIAAAKHANAHAFVSDLSEGYNTHVGERGVKLSGGQRQRLAIARTVLNDPDIVFFDEATSHVDTRTELCIHQSLAEWIADRTTVVIAHRLSTVRQADQLLVFDDGEILERGTHDELLGANGLYSNLWNIHVGDVESIPDPAQ